ncbi:hypothetical protein NFI96_006091 [Prochilodus magdalenae]|nr:hypothetical protein NFI96_006091 [Prochilodus magdalenae]
MKKPSLTEFQDQAQTELREDEYGVEGTMKKLSLTEFQDQAQTELKEDEYGVEGTMKKLSLTEFQDQAQTELREDEYGVEGTAIKLSLTEFQDQAQTELKEDEYGVEGTMKKLSLTEFQDQAQTELKEDEYGVEGTMKELSLTEFQDQAQTELREDEYGVEGTVTKLLLTEFQDQAQIELKEDEYGVEGTMKELSPTEFQDQTQTELREDEYEVEGTMKEPSLTEFQDQAQTELREDEYGVEGAMKKPSLTEFQDQAQTELREDKYGVEGTATKLSLMEFQDQAQTELREGEYGVEGTMKKLSLTEFQDQTQTELREHEYGVEGTTTKLLLTEFQDQAQTKLKEDEYGVEGTMKKPSLTEFQDQAQTELREDKYEVEGTMKEPSLTEFQDQAQTELKEDEYGVEGTMKNLSLTEFQDQVQTELEGSCLQDTQERQLAYTGMMKKLSSADEESCSDSEEEQSAYGKMMTELSLRGIQTGLTGPEGSQTEQGMSVEITRGSSVELSEVESEEYQRTPLSRPASLDAVQPGMMSDPRSAYQTDSLETTPVREGCSSHKSPDSIEPSPTKEFQCPDSLEASPTEQRPGEQSGSPDSQCLSVSLQTYQAPSEDAVGSSAPAEEQFTPEEDMFKRAAEIKVLDEMGKVGEELMDSTRYTLARVEGFMTDGAGDASDKARSPKDHDAPSCPETHSSPEPSTAYSSEGDDEDLDFTTAVKKQLTPEEEMFKMAAKIRVFDEIEKDAKTRRVKFDFTSTLQDRGAEAEDPTQEESSQVLPSYLESEQHEDPESTSLPQEVSGQAISDSQAPEYVEEAAVEEDESPLKALPMQIHTDGKEAGLTEPSDPAATDGELYATSAENVPGVLAPVPDGKSPGSQPLGDYQITDGEPREEPREEPSPDSCAHEEADEETSPTPLRGDLVPWSTELEDDESFESRIEAEERKVYALVADGQSHGTTPETTPGRTPTEEGTPNPFLFQEGKLFEMTRGGAIDMSKRSVEDDQSAFVFFPLREDPAEQASSEQAEEPGTISSTHASLLDPTTAASPEDSSYEESDMTPRGPSERSDEDVYESTDPTGPVSFRDAELDPVESSLANMDTATSTVTRSVYSEQDLESSDSSTEEEQHSVIEIPSPTQETIRLPSGAEPCGEEKLQSPISPKEPGAADRKPKPKIPAKAASFDQTLGQGDSTEQSRRPKSEADMGPSEWLTASIDCSSAKPKLPPSKLPVPVGQRLTGAAHLGDTNRLPAVDPQEPEDTDKLESTGQEDHAQASLDSDGASRPAGRPPSVGEDVFETRPNWEDCVETQMQRISDSSSPDRSKGTWLVAPCSLPLDTPQFHARPRRVTFCF